MTVTVIRMMIIMWDISEYSLLNHYTHARMNSSIDKGKVISSGQVVHQAGAYLRFLWHEANRSISTQSGWDASPSQGYPQH